VFAFAAIVTAAVVHVPPDVDRADMVATPAVEELFAIYNTWLMVEPTGMYGTNTCVPTCDHTPGS